MLYKKIVVVQITTPFLCFIYLTKDNVPDESIVTDISWFDINNVSLSPSFLSFIDDYQSLSSMLPDLFHNGVYADATDPVPDNNLHQTTTISSQKFEAIPTCTTSPTDGNDFC
jgi:hypothetical protein